MNAAERFATDIMERWQHGEWRPSLGLSRDDTEDCVMAAITECLTHPELYRTLPAVVFDRTLKRIANGRREEPGAALARLRAEYPCIEDKAVEDRTDALDYIDYEDDPNDEFFGE